MEDTKIIGLLERIADAAERIADALEPAEGDEEPMTVADSLQAFANCVSTENGDGLCETIIKAARVSSKKDVATG